MGWPRGYGRGRGGGYGGGPWGGGPPVPPPVPQPSQQPLQPPQPGVLRVVVAANDDRGLDSIVAPRFARAPFIVVVDISGGRVVDVKTMQNPYAYSPHGAGVGFAQWIISSGARAVIAPHVGPNAAMVLQQAGITIYTVAPGTRVADALRSLGLVRM